MYSFGSEEVEARTVGILGVRVQGEGVAQRAQVCRLSPGDRLPVWFWVLGLGLRVQGAGCRVQGAGCRAQGVEWV